jgi:hypothetical protein
MQSLDGDSWETLARLLANSRAEQCLQELAMEQYESYWHGWKLAMEMHNSLEKLDIIHRDTLYFRLSLDTCRV